MKSCRGFRRCLRVLCPPALYLAALTSVFGASTNIFVSGFEPRDGHTNNSDLIGYGGWLGDGSGGNGIVSNYIAGQGQQAYIGFAAPTNASEDYLVAWHPLNFKPLTAGLPIVKFSVLMKIVDSTNEEFDNFRWSIYNSQVERLFSLDFDNFYTNISYLLEGTNTSVATGVSFAPGASYTLLVTMNFDSNRWSATLNNALLATNQPISTTGATLDLGDIDAEWLIYDASAPGNNYMLFDNYHVTAESLPPPPVLPARVEFLDVTDRGWALLRIFGQTGSHWAVEATTNFLNWTVLNTNEVFGTYFDVVDTTAVGLNQRCYRARYVP